VGFIAGIIGYHPQNADELIEKMLPIKAEDMWFIVRAVRIPVCKLAGRAEPVRQSHATRQLNDREHTSGKLPTLGALSFENSPTTLDKLKGYTHRSVISSLATRHPNPSGSSDSGSARHLVGLYFATGSYGRWSVSLHVALVEGSAGHDKLTVGSMAKFTLASNCCHDVALLAMLQRAKRHAQPADAAHLERRHRGGGHHGNPHLRKAALAAIEDLKRKGPGYKRDLSTWGQVGQGAVALGCVAAGRNRTGRVRYTLRGGRGARIRALNYWTKD